MKYFSWIAIIFVVAAIITGIFLVGSPTHQRLVRFDDRRLSDLQDIQYQVSSYFSSKDRLPASLDEMKGFDGFIAPMDPESGKSYEYTVSGEMQFKLCADFSLSSEEQDKNTSPRYASPYGKSSSSNWDYSAGRDCFDLKLEKAPADKPTYPPSITVTPA
jgi:hypothetical protein